MVRYTQFSDGSSYMVLVGVLHGSRERCQSTTVNYPGLFANVEHCDILSFIHKWKTLDDLFDMAREKNVTGLERIFPRKLQSYFRFVFMLNLTYRLYY